MKKFLLIPLTIVLVIALIFGGCKPAAEVQEEIRIGAVVSLTGMFAGFGEGGIWGVQAAVDDINELGGVYLEDYGTRLPVKLIAVNCESDGTKVGSLAEDLVLRDKVHGFAGAQEPPMIKAPVAIIADRYKVPQIGGGPLEPWLGMREAITPPWEYTWSYAFAIATPPPPGDPRYGKPGYTVLDTWADWLVMFGDQTNKKVGIFASYEPDGIGWYYLYQQSLVDWGYDVIGIDHDLGLFPLETVDYTPIINEWKANDVEIVWGCCPAPHFGTLWRQCHELDFHPKMIGAARAALFYTEVTAWGGDLPWGVGIEMWWHPDYDPEACPGIGDTTPMSLTEKWTEETGQPLNPNIGWSYAGMQTLLDAIERAGTLEGDKVNKALSETNLMTINHLMKFDKETQFSWGPLVFGQWHKAPPPLEWDLPVIISKHDFVPATAEAIFPTPYD